MANPDNGLRVYIARERSLSERIGGFFKGAKKHVEFIKKFIDKLKKPFKPPVDLNKLRDTRLLIRIGAVRRVQIVIIYKKITTGEIKRYTVAPLSYRYRRLRVGIRKVLFAKDMQESKLKMFVLKNIRTVSITNKKYSSPIFPVEIT